MNKATLRAQLLRQRSEISAEDHRRFSDGIIDHLETFVSGKKNVFAYFPFRGEVDLIPWLQNLTVPLYLPRVMNQSSMKFFRVDPASMMDSLQPGFKGIYEPDEGEEGVPGLESLVVVPALAVDRNKYRLGYGGGYYDKFLQRFDGPAQSIVAIFNCFVIENVPVESWDQPVDYVVTDLGVF